MNLKNLLFSSQGRIPRSSYWYYTLALTVIDLLLILLREHFSKSNPPAGWNWLFFLPGLILFYPSIMVAIKRCHDRNRSAWFLIGQYIPHAFLLISLFLSLPLYYFGNDLSQSILQAILLIALILLFVSLLSPLWVFIELGFLRGTIGPNKYGPDPLQLI